MLYIQCLKWTVAQSPIATNILFGRSKAAPNHWLQKCIWTNRCARNKPFSTRTEELSTVEVSVYVPVSVKQQFLTVF
jgi:hypothetical protein